MSVISRIKNRNECYDQAERILLKMYSDGESYVSIIASIKVYLDSVDVLSAGDQIAVLDRIGYKYNSLTKE